MVERRTASLSTCSSMGEGLRPSPSRQRSGDLAEHKLPYLKVQGGKTNEGKHYRNLEYPL
jgi:hypothetical protein